MTVILGRTLNIAYYVGGFGSYVAKLRLLLAIAASERWGETRGLGTVKQLDRLSYLFSCTYGGGEGGIRTHVPVTRQHAFEARPLRPLRYLSD